MEKKLNKPYSRNIRLDKPYGLIGVPPDAPFIGANNVVVVARLTDSQCNALIETLLRSNEKTLVQ